MSSEAAPSDLLPPELTPEAAGARIAELKVDPAFQEKYLSGEVTARAEFSRLHTIVGKAPNESALHRASQFGALKKNADLPEKMWAHVAENKPVAAFEREEALRAKERCMRDRSFVARYLDGSREEVSLMTQISMILASPVKTGD
jgi:hypothetical protein